MFNSKLKRRVKDLEQKVDTLYDRYKCSMGEHEWEMQGRYAYISTPYIRCKHCGAKPEEKKP